MSAAVTRFPVAATARLKGAVNVAFDRDEHTVGTSAASVAGRAAGGHIVAIRVPAPTSRFAVQESLIVRTLLSAAERAPWSR